MVSSTKIEENAPYDAFCVFDADNIADKNFLKAMNKKLMPRRKCSTRL